MKILSTWKEIASYLGISVSTLRKNWKNWGIPIKLLPTSKYKKPMITEEKLRNWMMSN
ncbi:hypothetical protein [Thermodesulfobacterium hydrogeniphilum]|uniref:hypothetical protein n=1 Tax=Thermodesulfobacterium hydrogeniphilum TaxID=161156 RepID=UPI000B326150|nr:hypothetical protein [Thermodesulfobacterium hydrogeniphilum]